MTQGERPPSGIRGVTCDWVCVEVDLDVDVDDDDVNIEDGVVDDCIESRERRRKPFSRRIPRNVPF